MRKAHTIDVRHGLPSSMFGRKRSFLIKDSSYGNLSNLLHGLFKIFIHEEKSNPIDTEKIPDEFADNTTEDETRSLQQLEDCANAARKTEAYGQYE